jgi:two-component system, chemotaxis family, CheB/CheR fusion protein
MDDEKQAPHGFPVVGIGASSGGITALKTFFAHVPADSGMAFVVIVHLSKDHESILAEILQTSAAIPVEQVAGTMKVEPNRVYVIPPTKNLALEDGMILLTPRQETLGKRVPIDRFFQTLADAYGKDAYAVILSGSGSDGTYGIDRIKEAGGVALVQDPDEAEFDGMPRSAIATGLIDVILPADKLAAKIVAIYRTDPVINEHPQTGAAVEDQAQTLGEILAQVRARTGHDFINYKRPTLLRRIARRLQVHELPDMQSYLALLKSRPDEMQALLRDLLITVTNFFRDPESFDYLEQHVIPKLFEGKAGGDCVRVWSCGCGTGEEAYSLAILLHEHASRLADPPKIQVFASDINENAILTARQCYYRGEISSEVSPSRLSRYFTPKGEGYLLNKTLRDCVLFVPYNVLRDPPFSQLDLIVCRNLLIYLNRETQAKVMELFGFALRPGGFLFLGSSEGVDSSEPVFDVVDKKHRIYTLARGQRRRPLPTLAMGGKWETGSPPSRSGAGKPVAPIAALHHRLSERFAPPSVLIDDSHEILHIGERAERYLHVSGGEPTRDILRLIHPGLESELRTALINVRNTQRLAEVRDIALELDGEPLTLNLTVYPVEVAGARGLSFLVAFSDERSGVADGVVTSKQGSLSGDEALGAVIRHLEDELRHLKERLKVTQEESDINTEELKAYNEELQATNEELRSATEEMMSSREELQSVNEEIGAMNLELKEKVEEINRANADLQNLMQCNDIGTIFLDRDLKIKRYTRGVKRLYNIIAADIGRPFGHLTHRLDYPDLAADAAKVLETLQPFERQIHVAQDDATFLARILPYRTVDERIDGAVISFVDISDLKRTSAALEQRDLLLGVAQEAARAGVWTLDLKNQGAWWSDECSTLHGQPPGSVAMSMEHWIHRMHPDPGAVNEAIQQAIGNRTRFSHEFTIPTPEGDRWIMEVGKANYDSDGAPHQMAGISLDVTERVLLRNEQSLLLARSEEGERKLCEADKRKDEFLAMLAHELRNPLAPILIGVEVLKHAGSDSEEGMKVIDVIERQTTQMVRLIDDLLDVSRIASGKFRLRTALIDLRGIIAQAVETCQPLIGAAGHKLEVNVPRTAVHVDGDAARLVQAVSNLIHNAVKFTPAGGNIAVTLRSAGQEAEIRVQDDGDGIPPEMQDRIFDLFQQVIQPAGRLSKGLGIGLTLVRSLVCQHQGTVKVRSAGAGKGSTFIIRLPVVKAAAPPAAAPESTVSSATKDSESRKVLVVDDSREAADVLALFFDHEGFDVQTVYGGEAAVAACADHTPDIVFMDVGMPGMDGNEAARQIRKASHDVRPTLVALTGWGQESDRVKCMEAGFDHHLSKPVSPELLRNFMAEHS